VFPINTGPVSEKRPFLAPFSLLKRVDCEETVPQVDLHGLNPPTGGERNQPRESVDLALAKSNTCF